jgi:hypothetical protein
MRGMRGSNRPVRARLVAGLAALALVAAACSGGGDDEEATEETVALEEIEPIVDVEPCDLIDDATASELSGADVEAAESRTDDDGTTTCDFAFADEEVADETGSAIAASLSIGPGDEDDVPTGASVARTLSMGDASAAEADEDKVRVVYVVREVVVRVEIVPGDGEVSDELIEQVIEFTETTEPTVTEAVTGEPFVPDDTTTTSTTEPEEAEDFEAGDELDEVTETLTVDRPGGLDEFTFEADANAIAFIRFPVVTPTDPAGPCLRVSILDEEEIPVTSSGCLSVDGTSFIDRTILEAGGTYTVVFDPDANGTGTIEAQLTGVTDAEGTIEVDGDTETVAITQAGAVHRLDFEAEAGDAIFTSFPAATPTDPEGGCLRFTILGPDDIPVTSSGCLSVDGSSFIDRTELPFDGTYTLVFDPDGEQTGSADVLITAAD